MQRQEITIRFSDLRRLAATVPPYLAHLAGVNKKEVNLQTAVEDDWGMADLDTEMLLIEFGKNFRVDLTGFDFTGLITYNVWAPFPGLLQLIFLGLLLFPAWLVQVTATLLCWPFDRIWALAIWKTSLRKIFFPFRRPLTAEVLTVGDFVASAATGYFVKRERIRFVLG